MSSVKNANSAGIPLLVTAMFAAVGWGIVHVIDQLVDAPTVEYCKTLPKRDEAQVTIENLSRKIVFQGLKFGLRRPANTKGRFSTTEISADPPFFVEGTEGGIVTTEGATAEFLIPILHPGAKITMSAKFAGFDEVDFYLIGTNKNILDSSLDAKQMLTPINLLECGLQSFIIKNEIWIVFSFVLFFILVVFIYFILIPGMSVLFRK